MLFNCTFENKRGVELKHFVLCRECFEQKCRFYEDREIYGNQDSSNDNAECCEECGVIAADPNKAWYDTSKELSDKPR